MVLGFKTTINGKPTGFPEKILAELANNDGFDSVEDFFSAFESIHPSKDNDFQGQIIHWTDYRY